MKYAMATKYEESMVGIWRKRNGMADKMEPESTDIFILFKDSSIEEITKSNSPVGEDSKWDGRGPYENFIPELVGENSAAIPVR
jgi:hypothetical protein